MGKVSEIVAADNYTRSDIKYLLDCSDEERKELFSEALTIKERYVGKKVYFRGLIEFSNICSKDCLYCGIRKSNKEVERYTLTNKEILEAAKFAWESNYGSIVLQGGEMEGEAFTERIEKLLREIKELSNGELGITLSLGEQSEEVYRRWFNAGAHRYLLRIESSNPALYNRIHPNDTHHDFERRVRCLRDLKTIGYQTGTGVMIGLPYQTTDNLIDDLIFMRDIDIDMCGMGPYIEYTGTPLAETGQDLLTLSERFDLTLRMIATLRLMMKDINIAAATALQAIDPVGREKAVKVGANIIMPNITPGLYRDSYKLYDNKPCTDEAAEDCRNCLEVRVSLADGEIGYGEWGDSLHFRKRAR